MIVSLLLFSFDTISNMNLKKILKFVCFLPLVTSCSNAKEGGFSFTYRRSVNLETSGMAYYSDDYFTKDASIYNPSLATSSLCFALSSFANSTSNDSYTNLYHNAADFLTHNGFGDIFANSYFYGKPTTDSLGVVFGNKKIGESTLIAVGVRGGNYTAEWASNFTLGDGKELKNHQGFYEASTIYLDSLSEYLTKYKISGEVKIWSVGYSRGSAANNIASARLDKKISEGTKIFEGIDVQLKKEDLYAYCFETPQGASFNEEISPRDEIYSNIHNVINHNDLVSKVGMSDFSFTRYGVDYYLPDRVRVLNYSDFLSKMLKFYNKLDNRSSLGDYLISDFDMRRGKEEVLNVFERTKVRKNWTLGLFEDEFISELAQNGVQSRENYAANIQTGLREICKIIYLNGEAKFSLMNLGVFMARTLINDSNVDIVVNNLINNQSAFITDFLHALKSALEALDVKIEANTLTKCVETLVMAIGKTFAFNVDYFFSLISVDNLKAIAMGHYPDVCYSNLMALDPNYSSDIKEYVNDGSYYYLEIPSVKEETRISVFNDNGDILAQLKDGEILKSSSLSCASFAKTFVCYIPVDIRCKIEIENAESYDLAYFDQRYQGLVDYEKGNIPEGEIKNIHPVTYPEKQQ